MAALTSLEKILSPNVIDEKGDPILYEKKIVIFLVDDDELYLKSLEIQFLENRNISIKTFLTGESCLENIALKPDVVILDYFLNSSKKDALDGLKTLILIKEASPGTQVIMSSTNESAEIAVSCLNLGAFDYHVKNDNTFLKLKESIKKILGLYSKEKELIVWDW